MSKRKEIREIPATTREVIVATICDLCGKEYSGDNWDKGSYERHRVDVSYEFGEVYPECGSTETIVYDICPKCFEEKLIPWLKSQGAEYRTEKTDW